MAVLEAWGGSRCRGWGGFSSLSRALGSLWQIGSVAVAFTVTRLCRGQSEHACLLVSFPSALLRVDGSMGPQ